MSTELQTTLKLLADPTRLRLLLLLSAEELAVQELVEISGMTQSRISNQLSLLRRAGLVRDRREGTWSFHSLVAPEEEGSGLTPALYEAVLVPAREEAEAQADLRALEVLREARRDRSRRTHGRLAPQWTQLGQGFATGAIQGQALASLVPRGLKVADLGCGAGYLSAYLAGRGAAVVAVDHAPAMLEEARGTVPEGVEFRQGELDDLPLADGEMDAAFANLVWHHLADARRAAQEILRILRPGGTVVITDLLPHDQEWMREGLGDLRLGLRPETVMTELARVGFTELLWESVKDRYEVEGGNGHAASLSLFLVRGTRPQEA